MQMVESSLPRKANHVATATAFRHPRRGALCAAFAAILGLSAAVMAGPLEDGMTAYRAKDYIKALQLWRPLAEAGDPEAQSELGTLYAEGKGVAASDLIAAAWFQRAAEQGVAGAQYNLAVSYAEGLGVKRDDALAAKWFRRAADQGMAYAQLNLGLMYSIGRGVPKDNIEAVRWLETAIFNLPPGGARSDAASALKTAADQLNDEELLKARTLQRGFKPVVEPRPKADSKMIDSAKPLDTKPTGDKAGEGKPAEGKSTDAKPSEPRAADAKAGDPKAPSPK
jgi:TPR repeat protein